MFSTDFIFRQQENLVDNQKCQAGFRLLCNKILFLLVKRQKKVNRTKKAELRPKFRWENPILSFFFAEDKYGYKEAKIPSINSILKTAFLPDLSKLPNNI